MANVKFRATQLFNGREMLPDDQVLIVTEDGIIENIVSLEDAGDNVQAFEGILSPGFINCHCHLELSHLKGKITESTGLVNFVLEVVRQRNESIDKILDAITLGEEEMLRGGILAVGDICNNSLTIAQKLIQRLSYHNFVEISGVPAELANQRFQKGLLLFSEFDKELSSTPHKNSIAPHAPYSVGEKLWDQIVQHPGNGLISLHNQESASENEWFLNKSGEMRQLFDTLNIDSSTFQPSGKTSLQTCLKRFRHQQQLILVHNVFTSLEDFEFCKKSRPDHPPYWCLCPNANWYISKRLPDINLLIAQDCELVLGTDSLASNHQLSILSEMQTIRSHFPLIPVRQILNWGTLNGAKALQLDGLLGSFEPGKKPGVLLLTTDFDRVTRLK